MHVYLVRHSRPRCESIGAVDVKVLGIYSSSMLAEQAVARLRVLPAFSDPPDSFHVDRYELDVDSWHQGVVAQAGLAPSMSDVEVVEVELVRRLLERGHLNVPERALLAARMRPSLVVEVLEQILRETAWFPRDLRSTSGFPGACLEQRGTELWLHESHEIGLGRTSPWRSARVADLADAVERLFPGHHIDGVRIR